MSQFDDAYAVRCSGAFDARWRAEVGLLGLLCPEPKYRWGEIGGRLRIDIPDFSSEDTNLIARALCVGCEHGARICALLSRNLLIEAGRWDNDDLRDEICRITWGPAQLAALFYRSLGIPNEATAIAKQLGRVRRLPTIPPM